MVIVSSRRFMQFGGSQTLLGELSRHWQIKSPTDIWLDWRDVAGGSVDLLGVAAPHPAKGALATTYCSTESLQTSVASTLATPWPYRRSTRGFDVSKLFPPLPQRPRKEGDQASGNNHQTFGDTVVTGPSSTLRNKTYASCAAAPKSMRSVPTTPSPRSYQNAPTSGLSSFSSALPNKPIGRRKTPQITKTKGINSSNRYVLLTTSVLL